MVLKRAPRDAPRSRYTRARSDPPRLSWFGFRSFWGHLRHFAASFIATDDIDARDWMTPDPPTRLAKRVAATCGFKGSHDSVLENAKRDVFFDYLADSGDHPGVARAIASTLVHEYALPNPRDPEQSIKAPRGEVLLFGGDTAYPVATVGEIRNRLVVPFNEVLPAEKGRRAILGIPGNHDWYDGLDGFARLFRIKSFDLGHVSPTTQSADTSHIGHAVELFGRFVVGDQISKEKAVVLRGYAPAQNCSYFALPLTDDLHLFGLDRQLKKLDFRQRQFFRRWRQKRPGARLIIMMPNPALEFGRPSDSGMEMLSHIGVDPEREDVLIIAGDIHHYRRETLGRSTHVTAGGGGAFLHPAPLRNAPEPEVEFPGKKQSRSLLRKVPLHIAFGRAGLIPHVTMAAVFAPALGFTTGWLGHDWIGLANTIAGVASAVIFALLGGVRKSAHKFQIIGLAALAGMLITTIPTFMAWRLLQELETFPHIPTWVCSGLSLVAAVIVGGFSFGSYLTALTWLGLEETQAFTSLSHPSFKHFLRMRVREDGSGVDVWCIGLVDPLNDEEEPVLVDAFSWPRPESKEGRDHEGHDPPGRSEQE